VTEKQKQRMAEGRRRARDRRLIESAEKVREFRRWLDNGATGYSPPIRDADFRRAREAEARRLV
jgi:hypothetical protein